MELVTGYGGKAHITPENWADLNRLYNGDFGAKASCT